MRVEERRRLLDAAAPPRASIMMTTMRATTDCCQCCGSRRRLCVCWFVGCVRGFAIRKNKLYICVNRLDILRPLIAFTPPKPQDHDGKDTRYNGHDTNK